MFAAGMIAAMIAVIIAVTGVAAMGIAACSQISKARPLKYGL
jgi:hypothetical protein